jgi:tetratricopeptide (TPR) repeat protein
MVATGKQWRLIVLVAAAAGSLLFVGWRMWDVGRSRRAMAEIEQAMEAGRNGWAARELRAFLRSRPDSDRAAYLLGVCEKGRGQTEEAFEAWGRVPPESSLAGLAILGRMKLRSERGRLADAEEVVGRALEDHRLDRLGLGAMLVYDFTQEGRVEEAARLLEESWKLLREYGEGASERAIGLARTHMELDRETAPIEVLRTYFEQAARLAPEDDRVVLGRANLAIRAGLYDEAARWLDACLRRRPEDASVWRSRLKWAMAANRPSELREALRHLRVANSTPAEIGRVAVWLAAHRRDSESERRGLERLITDDPSDCRALERLAELAITSGQPARAAELRARKTEVDRLMARYRKLYERNQPARDAVEMALLGEQLGRWFEARVFLTVALDEEPDRADLRSCLDRLSRRAENGAGPGRSLAEVLASELGAEGQPEAQTNHGATNP